MEHVEKLERVFYTRDDVVEVARDLLGKVLCTRIDGHLTCAVITETEAYAGKNDRASHAFGGRRTKRNEPMYDEGGIAYVYLCYGIHHLFNIVTGMQDDPQAVLIRAGRPLTGLDEMLERRGTTVNDESLLGGPGSLARALGIHTRDSGTSLLGNRIWLEDHGIRVAETDINVGPRIGVDYAGDDAKRPYRFMVPAAVKLQR